jgi:hypothetical protein
MSNTLGIDYAEDATEMIDDAGQRCKISSTWYPCEASAERRAALIEDESALEVFERDVQMIASAVGSIPAPNSTIIIGTTRYFVVDVQLSREADVLVLNVRRNVNGRIS